MKFGCLLFALFRSSFSLFIKCMSIFQIRCHYRTWKHLLENFKKNGIKIEWVFVWVFSLFFSLSLFCSILWKQSSVMRRKKIELTALCTQLRNRALSNRQPVVLVQWNIFPKLWSNVNKNKEVENRHCGFATNIRRRKRKPNSNKLRQQQKQWQQPIRSNEVMLSKNVWLWTRTKSHKV